MQVHHGPHLLHSTLSHRVSSEKGSSQEYHQNYPLERSREINTDMRASLEVIPKFYAFALWIHTS